MIGLNKSHPLYVEDINYVTNIPGIASLQGKSILITGASGLIGVFIVDVLMALNKQGAGITVYAVGRNKFRAEERLGEYYNDDSFHFIEQDVRVPLPENIRVDYIIPLASNTHPLAYSLYPIETIEINIKGAEYALLKASECSAEVLYPSTVEIYGNARDAEDFTEESTGCLNLATSRACYTESKRLSEALCQSYIAEKNVKVKIVRLSRVFGPTMLMDDSKASSQFVLKALNGEDIVLKSKGDQFFSYTYLADAVAAMFYVLIHGDNGRAYNIANKKCNVRLKDFAKVCADIAGTQVVFDIPSKAERSGFSIATRAIMDADRLCSIGFSPQYSFSDAVERTVKILE